jgi:hypothetical protein
MTTNSISSYTTLISIAHNQFGDELNIDNWNCEFKNWKMQSISNGKYYTFLKKVEIDCRVTKEPIYRENPIMWKIILRKNPKTNYFVAALSNVNHVKDRSHNPDDPSIQGENTKDRGHFIADSFEKYLLTNDERNANNSQSNQFFGINNKSNISPQDFRANRNSKEYAGQLRFEQKVRNYLEKSTNANEEVYYEIEEIKIEEKVLGRRIFIHWNQSDEADIHVFIPEDRD